VCVKKKSETARFVTKATKCKKGETKLSWNSQGPAGPQGSSGAPGASGAPGTPGAPGTAGATALQAQVATFDTASSDPEIQPLFSYGGDSIATRCGAEGNPSYAGFYIKGDNALVFGSNTTEDVMSTTTLESRPGFGLLAPGNSYQDFDSESFGAGAGYSSTSSTQETLLESGPGALDFHVELDFEFKDISTTYSECKFAATYYPVAAG